VIRRYRLLEAAEAVRHGETVSWADLATTLGYSDQAHLIRDFRTAIGRTPASYARSQAQRCTSTEHRREPLSNA
jgi:AraC-like DNA-binding protein